MPIKDLKFFDLTGDNPVEITPAPPKLPASKMEVKKKGATLSWTGVDVKPTLPDSFEIAWTDDTGDNKVRGGSSNAEYAENKFTLSDLTIVTGFGLSINGKMKIKDPKSAEDDPASATISVRIGNMGEGTRGQWVIDLSDKQGGGEGSKLNVGALIAWTSNKADAGSPELPPMNDAQKKKLNDFVIEFEEFHFNISKKTFNIDVKSAKGSSLQIDKFIIDEVGFQMTNEPPKEKEPEDVEAEEVRENGTANELKAARKPKELPAGQQ